MESPIVSGAEAFVASRIAMVGVYACLKVISNFLSMAEELTSIAY